MTREEAINEIKSWAIPSKKGREVLETLIPELAESEDESLKNKSGYYKAGKFWKASTLWNATKNKIPQRVPNRYILQECTWNIGTLQRFADEVKNVQEVSLDYPIILDMNGNIIDGAHRVVKAYLEGKDIDIVYIGDDEWPEPDYDEEKAVKESDDERIRKRLIEYFEGFRMGNAEVRWEGLIVQEVLAWLKKQKECVADNSKTSTDEDERIINQLITLVNSAGEVLLIPTNKEELVAWLNKYKESLHIPETCKENADSFTEDERIRQWLYNLVDEGAYLCERPFATESILSYLEKQKEQKPAESISQLTVQDKGVYKICPRCKSRMIRDDSKVYTSIPPQYGYECPKCGEMEFDTVMYDNPEMEEQKPVKCIDFNNEFENQVSHLLASVLDKEYEYSVGFVKHAAQSLLGYAKNELKSDYCLYGGYPSVGRCRWCYASCSARLTDVHTDDEKEYVRTIKSIISDFIRDKKPENLAYYQRIYDWLDGRHVPFSCGHENGTAEWSEEDEKTINDACCWIAEYAGYLMNKNYGKASMLMGLTDKLKSLRPPLSTYPFY